jgi:hypothetical protein
MTLRAPPVVDGRGLLRDDIFRYVAGDTNQVALCVTLRVAEAEIAILNSAEQDGRAAGVALCHIVLALEGGILQTCYNDSFGSNGKSLQIENLR